MPLYANLNMHKYAQNMLKYAKICSDPISISPMHSYAMIIIMHVYACICMYMQKYAKYVGRRCAAALLPRLVGKNPRSHYKGATGRVRTGDQWPPVLCHCQLGQDFPCKHEIYMQHMQKFALPTLQGCLVQVGNGIELEVVGLQFEPYRWRSCGVTWDSSQTVVVIT